jgi:hypothetical protein
MNRFFFAVWLVLALLAPLSVAQDASSEPSKVVVGVYVNDIQQLDLITNSYAMDFYIWFRWTNPDLDPVSTMEFINPFQSWGLIATPQYEEPQEMPDGSLYNSLHIQGQFNTKLPLDKYPFDSQELIVQIEDNTSTANDMVYVADTNGATLNPELVLPGYTLGTPRLDIVSQPYVTNFGDVRLTQPEPFSRATIVVPVTRPPFAYTLKLIVPILLIGATAFLLYRIHPSFVEGRIGVAITLLLTLVALQITTNSQLPPVEYLMMIDMLYVVGYLFVILTMWHTVRTSWLAERGQMDLAVSADHRTALILGSAFVVANLAVLISYITR